MNIINKQGLPLHALRSAKWSPFSNEVGIFQDIARINHACDPNANLSYNRTSGRTRLYAIKPIAENEEITISYLPESAVEKWDMKCVQDVLRKTFGFTCICPMHTSFNMSYRASHDKLLMVDVAYENLAKSKDEAPSIPYHHIMFIALSYQLNNIVDVRSARIVEEALSVACRNGDRARAKVFAEKAKSRYMVLEGPEGEKTEEMSDFIKDASLHKDWKAGGIWETSVEDIPTNLGEEVGWLWMRGKWAHALTTQPCAGS